MTPTFTPANGKIVSVTEFKGDLFVATENGFYWLENGRLVQIPFAETYMPEIVVGDGNEYIQWVKENM